MASFTDAVTQFNPYVQELPVDEMYAVGTYKQQQYDQGVQKVQAYIDNIAGLDVMKGGHKQYLQSKLGELGNKLKTVAAGDFSNQQLVGSVGGMATQIIKDPVIQNAVYSTQVYRKQEGIREALAKEGKTSPENDDWWNGEVNDFLKNPDLKTPFSGEYVAYRDLDKKLREIGDKVKEVTKSIDVPYIHDDAGNVIYFEVDPATGGFKRDAKQQLIPTTKEKGGREYVDRAMLKIKIKGTPAQKILDNFYDSLDEGDKKQLLITANYHYKRETPQSFKEDIIYSFDKNKDMLEKQLVSYELDLKKSGLTDDQREQIENQIANTKDVIKEGGELDKQMAARLAEIDATPNSKELKYKIYTQKYLTNKAEHMSNQSYEQEIVNSPYMQTDIEFMKMEQAAARMKQDHADFISKFNQDERKEYTRKVERAQDQDKEDKKEAEENAGKMPVVLPSENKTDISKPTVSDLITETTVMEGDRVKTIAKYGNSLFPGLSVKGQREALTKLMSNYRANPSNITNPDEMNYIKDMIKHESNITLNSKRLKTIIASGKVVTDDYGKQLASQTGMTVGKVAYTAKELLDLNANLGKITKTDSYAENVIGDGPTTYIDYRAAMKKYAGTKYAPIVNAMFKSAKGETLNDGDKIMIAKVNSIRNWHNKNAPQALKLRREVEQQTMNDIVPEKTPKVATLSETNNLDMGRVDQLVGRKLLELQTMGAVSGLAEGETIDAETISAIRKGKYERILTKNDDGTAKVTLKAGKLSATLPMNAEEFNSYFPKYAPNTAMSGYADMVEASPNYTTNKADIKGKGTGAVTAGISGFEIPGISNTAYAPITRLDIVGDPNNKGRKDSEKLYSAHLYTYNNKTGNWKLSYISGNEYQPATKIDFVINNIGPTTIQSLYK